MYSVVSSFWDFKGNGEVMDKRLLMSSPYPITFILLSYLWFVLKFGPEFMKHRKPFRLENILVVYNITQMLVALYIFLRGSFTMYRIVMSSSTCLCETDQCIVQHHYLLVKVVELLETVFFVLRKKQSQVTFLHVYHHVTMTMLSWYVVKINPTDSTIFIGTINSLVHIVMYGYYGLSVFPALVKYLWWKKYITMIQLIQFCLVFVHIVVSHMVSSCKPAYLFLFVVCTNSVLFFYLFGDFYLRAYTNKFKTNSEDVKLKTLDSGSSGDAKNCLKYLETRARG